MKKENHMPRIVVICGPTGAGKTAFAIKLAKAVDGEIIGADSMQIYRQMDIGTAKPTLEEKAAVVHHMVDVAEPDENFDAAGYARLAKPAVMDVISRNKIPFVVGGTGLYIKALIYGLFQSSPSDQAIRERLKKEKALQGLDALYAKLIEIDPDAAVKIHKNDALRIIRALEVYEITGKTISEHHMDHGFKNPLFNPLKLGVFWDRDPLYERINKRVDMMLEQGLPAEVENLLKRGYSPQLKSMQSLGYRHMIDFLSGKIQWEEAVSTLKRDHRRYAKRQMTWFNSDETIIWINPEQIQSAVEQVKAFFKKE